MFVIVTFPLKCVLFGGADTAAVISAVRDSSSFLLTLALRRIYQRYWKNEIGSMIALIVVSCSLAGLLQGGFLLLLNPFLTSEAELSLTAAGKFDVLYERTGLLIAWSFLYYGIRQAIDGIRHELRIALIESEKRQALLEMLRTQMNPHFLFNALNMIQAEIGLLNSGLRATVQALSDYLRYSLENRNCDRVELRQEVEAIRNYLTVEGARFPDELKIEWFIEEKALDILVPGILIQPLVENAVKYGRRTSPELLTINLTISCPNEAFVKIVVSNTGRWVTPQPQPTIGGVGLENVRQRLALLYPENDCLRIREENGWVTVELQIPVDP